MLCYYQKGKNPKNPPQNIQNIMIQHDLLSQAQPLVANIILDILDIFVDALADAATGFSFGDRDPVVVKICNRGTAGGTIHLSTIPQRGSVLLCHPIHRNPTDGIRILFSKVRASNHLHDRSEEDLRR